MTSSQGILAHLHCLEIFACLLVVVVVVVVAAVEQLQLFVGGSLEVAGSPSCCAVVPTETTTARPGLETPSAPPEPSRRVEAWRVCLVCPRRRVVGLVPLSDLTRWEWAGAGVRRRTVSEAQSWQEAESTEWRGSPW